MDYRIGNYYLMPNKSKNIRISEDIPKIIVAE